MEAAASVLFDYRLQIEGAAIKLLRRFRVCRLLTRRFLALMLATLDFFVELRIRVNTKVRLDSRIRLRAARTCIYAFARLR